MFVHAKSVRAYTQTEEVWHSALHGVGVVFGIVALSLLVCLSAIYGNVWSVVSCAIFGSSFVFLYSASTLYHAIVQEKIKKRLKKLDHIAIYYLIAGTYTPFLLVLMRGTLGWILFGIIWGLALLGTFLKLFSSGSGTKFWSLGLYLGMGWMIILASKQLLEVVSFSGVTFLVLGGGFYTLGIVFYVWKSKPYTHVLWHLFVLLGTVMHFFAILFSCALLHS